MPLDSWSLSLLPARRRTQLDPIDVLAHHLFYMQDLDLGACSCNILRWVHQPESAAPLLVVFWLRVDPHRPSSRHDVAVPLPRNFFSTHPHLRRVFIEGAFLSSWAAGLLTSLTVLSISASDSRNASHPAAASATPTTDAGNGPQLLSSSTVGATGNLNRGTGYPCVRVRCSLFLLQH
jgi:hypothetical protein